jgi:hypothetical protein
MPGRLSRLKLSGELHKARFYLSKKWWLVGKGFWQNEDHHGRNNSLALQKARAKTFASRAKEEAR